MNWSHGGCTIKGELLDGCTVKTSSTTGCGSGKHDPRCRLQKSLIDRGVVHYCPPWTSLCREHGGVVRQSILRRLIHKRGVFMQILGSR